jgi:DNA-binding transcriptional LysR family regulator
VSGRAELAGVDLNLLVALDALLAEANVTRAAARVGLSQPAMSRALGRLRDLLGDPLLVRDGARMRPTARAEAVAPRVRQILAEVQATLRDAVPFDPARHARTFVLATNDYCGALLLPGLIQRLRDEAPRVDLKVRALGPATPVEALAEGALDLAVGTFMDHPPSLARETLFEDGFVCAVRAGHPLAAGRLTLRRYAAAEHLLVSAPGEGPGVADLALAEHGLGRRVAVRVPHFLLALRLVEGTDLLLTLPRRLAEGAAAERGLVLLKPPLALPRFTVEALVHPRAGTDPGLVWLRGLIRGYVGGGP